MGYSYATQSGSRRNVSVWDSCAPVPTLNKRVRTTLMLLEGGQKVNGGLVLNYHTVGTTARHDEYMVAELDQPTDSLRLRLWTGTTFLTVAEAAGVGIVPGDWYRVEAEITPGPDPLTQTRIRVEVAGVTDPAVTASVTAVTTRYLPADGRFGVATDRALSRFCYFQVTEV